MTHAALPGVNALAPSPNASASLIKFSGQTITIANFSFRSLVLDLDAVPAFDNCSIDIVNSSFVNNSAQVTGGVLVQSSASMSVLDFVFSLQYR